MIATVTLNTSIDKAYTLEAPISVGEVQRVAMCIDTAGGKGLNAARSVHTCGEKVIATGFVGGNNGRLLCELLAADGVEEDFVRVEAETRCCINLLEPNRRSTEFLEPGRSIHATEFEHLKEKLREIAAKCKVISFSGSAPAGILDDVYAVLVRIVREMGAHAVLDTSGNYLVRGVEGKPFLIKPNTDEIAAILGHKPCSLDEVVAAARELHARGIEEVVVSLGAHGAVMCSDEGVFRGTPPAIELVNPVGSGDTMIGAFDVAIARGDAPSEQLRFAMGCATANCLTPETGHFELAVAMELAKRTQIERLA